MTKVFVNEIELDTIKYPKFEMYSSAFEIPLTEMGFKLGDKMVIKILHKDDCKPKVLIIDYGKPKSTFDVVKMEVTEDGVLKWTSKEENGKIPYVIEQFRWNKWVKVGEVDGKGAAGENGYEFKLSPNSGENKVRVKQVDYSPSSRYSKPLKFISKVKEVTF